MEISKHEPGMFSWADLAAADGEGAKQFYTRLLGLEAVDVPMGGGHSYVMLTKNGKKVCALYEMTEDVRQKMGGHPTWCAYFTVESADASAARVEELGGSVMQQPFDMMDSGRMAVAQDPTGAAFFMWEPRAHIGAEVFGEPGALAWTELYTPDTGAAAKFYEGLFGWSADRKPNDYFEFAIDGRSAAGMLEIKEEWGYVPPNWSIYLTVADLDKALESAAGMGAAEVMPPMEIEHVGRFVVIKDPQGTYVGLIQMAVNPS